MDKLGLSNNIDLWFAKLHLYKAIQKELLLMLKKSYISVMMAL